MSAQPLESCSKTHLFDGVKLHRDWQNFQLCDISEPELASLIADRDGMRETCYVSLFAPHWLPAFVLTSC